jgi:ERCC4-related helicase
MRGLNAGIGVVVKGPIEIGDFIQYRVNFGGSVENCDQESLELVEASTDPEELVSKGILGETDAARVLLTYLRLKGRLNNFVYAFFNSRTRFFPYQFKPLIKFMDISDGRLLIADEVGLGKTIEAGLILLEMKVRNELNNALVVCPSKLKHKWYMELVEKFGLRFPILDRAGFLQALDRSVKFRGEPFLGIVGYETIRNESVIARLEEADFEWDLLIADEGHSARNDQSWTFKGLETLASKSAKKLILSATPLNNKSRDLFNLLIILDPEVYRDFGAFEDQRLQNALIVKLENNLRGALPLDAADLTRQLSEITQGQASELLSENPAFQRLGAICRSGISTAKTQVEALRLASMVNLLHAHVVRTRKREVHEKAAQRQVQALEIQLNQKEVEFYQGVQAAVRAVYGGNGLAKVSIERVTASSLHALADSCLRDLPADWDDEDDDEAEGESDLEREVAVVRVGFFKSDPLLKLVDTVGREMLAGQDTKWERLKAALEGLIQQDPISKVILFTGFRRTIDYLNRKLLALGFKVFVLHGGVPTSYDNPELDERSRRINDFKQCIGPAILLSSEVGSEGLDFQFTNKMVNWDLPWNPMRVEQRIGRIDRIGQESLKLNIIHLVQSATVDQVIYDRLIRKLDLITNTIGGVESVLGEYIQDLQALSFEQGLTEAERQQRLSEIERAYENQVLDYKELEQQSHKVVGTDEFIMQEIDRIRKGKRYVGPEELCAFVHGLLSRKELATVPDNHGPGVWKALFSSNLVNLIVQHADDTSEARRFSGRAQKREEVLWTFDPEIAFKRSELELLNERHPLVACLCRWYESVKGEVQPTFSAVLPAQPDRSPGDYLVGVYEGRYTGEGERRELDSIAVRVSDGQFMDAERAAEMTADLAILGREADLPVVEKDSLSRLLANLGKFSLEHHGLRKTMLFEEWETKRRQRLQYVMATHQRRTSRLAQEIENLRDRGTQGQKGLIAIRENRMRMDQASLDIRLEKIKETIQVSGSYTLRCMGWIRVEV